MRKSRTKVTICMFLLVILIYGLPATANEYLLGVGDVLAISVWGHNELTTEVAVRPDGYLTFPLVGDIWAVDKTARALSKEIQSQLAEYIVNPQVTVIISHFRTLQVQVLGEVRSTGYYNLKSGSRLMDVLALAGGPTKSADLDKVSITRYNMNSQGIELTSVLHIDVNQFIQGGDLKSNPIIQSGDMIFVPTTGRATIFGEVRQPTSYDLGSGLGILDLLALAGGALDSADLARVVVTSQGEDKPNERIVNVQSIMSGGSKDVRIDPNDVVFVPKKQRVMLFGAVKSPGIYVLDKETSLIDLLARSGGLLPSGNSSSISITRNVDGEQDISIVNASPGLSGQKGGDNPLLVADDLIFVPEGEQNALVLGEVRSPGAYVVKEHTTVLDLLAQAGGTHERAGENITLTRNGESKEINLYTLERQGLNNEKVMPGDVIYVAEVRRQVLVLGEVRNPGYFQFRVGDRILDAIASAGGLTSDAQEDQVSLTRHTQEKVNISIHDFGRLMTERSLPDNVLLHPQDVIIVPKANRNVLVFGEVARSGVYTLPPDGRILDILALAGGVQQTSGIQTIVLTRQDGEDERVWHVDYQDLMDNQNEHNLAVDGGDVIYVPASKKQILVLGQVKNPGAYNLPPGGRVMDALALAGGPLERAALENVGIYRDGSVEDSESVIMGKDKVLFTGDVKENPQLEGGDIIYIPETKKPDWLKIFSFVGAIKSFKDAVKSILTF